MQPNLVKKRTINHITIINNTSDHLNRLDIKFERENIKTFLLSTRFLFQSLNRVRFYNNNGEIIDKETIDNYDIFILPPFVKFSDERKYAPTGIVLAVKNSSESVESFGSLVKSSNAEPFPLLDLDEVT